MASRTDIADAVFDGSPGDAQRKSEWTAARSRYYLSPVDYEAWGKGYLPPSEHVLIDALAYRDAKVVSATSFNDFSCWLVMKGARPGRKRMKLVQMAIMELLEPDDDPPPKPVTGFFALLTPEQLRAALAYQGGDDWVGPAKEKD